MQNFLFLLSCIIHFVAQIKKHVTKRNRTLNLSSLSVNWENPVLDSCWLIIQNHLCQILCLVLEFFVKQREFGLFFCSLMSCPNSVKQLWPAQSHEMWTTRVSFDLPKVSKTAVNLQLFKVSKPISLKIYFPSEKLEMSNQVLCLRRRWQHHLLIMWQISSIFNYRGATVIKFAL